MSIILIMRFVLTLSFVIAGKPEKQNHLIPNGVRVGFMLEPKLMYFKMMFMYLLWPLLIWVSWILVNSFLRLYE